MEHDSGVFHLKRILQRNNSRILQKITITINVNWHTSILGTRTVPFYFELYFSSAFRFASLMFTKLRSDPDLHNVHYRYFWYAIDKIKEKFSLRWCFLYKHVHMIQTIHIILRSNFDHVNYPSGTGIFVSDRKKKK